MTEPEIVIEDVSPHGNLEAIVEQDDRVAYLYLRAPDNEDFGVKTCWVRNLAAAPEALDVKGMQGGNPPMLPREHCLYPQGQPPLDAERLRFVWFPEGDGLALLEDGEMIAAIPAWGGFNGFSGYARDCKGESDLCWKLDDPTDFHERIAAADRYWASWDGERWDACQDAFLAAYEKVLGPHARYFAIDGGKWPPKALIRINAANATYLLTLGISLRPQPDVEMHYEDPADFRRFEFAACLSPEVPESVITKFAGYLSGQSSLPWDQFTFFGHGHTVGCDVLAADAALSEFSALLLLENPPGAPKFDLPRQDGEKVTLLWTVPITSAERQFAEREKSQELLKRFPVDWPLHRIGRRAPVVS